MSATPARSAPRIRVAMFSAWIFPIRPAPITPMLRVCVAMRDYCGLEIATSQKLPVPPRKLFRRTHAGQHALFHDDPAGVIFFFQFIGKRFEVDVAFAQFAKDAVLERLEIIPFIRARLFVHGRIAIFEVDVPDAVLELTVSLEGVAATTETIVARVKAKADQIGIGGLHQVRDFPRRLDKPGAMMMEHAAQSRVTAHGISDTVHS